MASKCTKCVKVTKDGVQCFQCENIFHAKCVGVNEEVVEITRTLLNFKWYCDICLKTVSNIRLLTKTVNDNNNEIKLKVDQINAANISLKHELDIIKNMIKDNGSKLEKLDEPGSKLSVEIDHLKSELQKTWASVVGQEVKKGMQSINVEVKTVQKTLDEAQEIKEREKNIMMFNVTKGDNDRDRVKEIIKKLSSDIKDSDMKRIIRLGKRVESTNRPILIVMDNISAKELVMKSSYKLKQMSEKLSKVWIANDLTAEQRSELKSLIANAKSREAACTGGFLYRVKGPVGKWRIVSFKKLPVLKTFEALAIKLKINGTHIVLLAVYRPGSALISSLFFQELVAVLEIISLLSNNVVLAGDFNVHVEKHMDPHSVSLCEIFGNFNLVNRINEPTHELGGVIDLIITSMSFPVFDIRVLPPGVFSDHGLVQACLSIDQVIRMKKKDGSILEKHESRSFYFFGS
ncbi:hypothetical protein HELRODRAFT_158525 [Helobdella robusta]|uniref:Zinc finger PHD-type domain-containing protein n=1 Tax=Helobdella robusta TaxID=6412 RepID=T1EMW8_HELRO|nr:hypothetical protein HELRODRAFT_158525 [Helobdella robusta]ESO12100.1 hypothetical protein HELRODRAFT_158525 [Helobdella robusta]